MATRHLPAPGVPLKPEASELKRDQIRFHCPLSRSRPPAALAGMLGSGTILIVLVPPAWAVHRPRGLRTSVAVTADGAAIDNRQDLVVRGHNDIVMTVHRRCPAAAACSLRSQDQAIIAIRRSGDM